MQQAISPATTFYWFDYETFGLNRFCDRPAQFSGQRTDANLENMGAGDNWFCRPSVDYLPTPESCLVTAITPQAAARKGVSESQFAGRIQAVFTQPNTICVGYNNYGFDDDVTRFLFWRNLLDPYEREWKNGCSRWDLLPFVRVVWALRPQGITWPQVTVQGVPRVSFRLEDLSQANRLEHSHAHDASSDVAATIALARLLRRQQPKLWAYALANRGKDRCRAFLENRSHDGATVLWVDGHAGQEKGYLRFIVPVATSPVNKNEVLVWDCREDPTPLATMRAEEIALRAFGPGKELEEKSLQRIGLRRIKVNASPFLCPDLRVVSAAVAKRFDIQFSKIAENARKLAEISKLIAAPVAESVEVYRQKPDENVKTDVEASLYEGSLPGMADKIVMQKAKSLAPQALADAVAQGRIHFEDSRLDELLFRLRARNWPETLSAPEKDRWRELCRRRLQDGTPGFLTFEAFSNLLDEQVEKNDAALEAGTLTEEAYDQRAQILEDLCNWGEFVGEQLSL